MEIHPSVAGVLRLGVARFVGIGAPGDDGAALGAMMDAEIAEIERRWGETTVAEVPGVQEARTLYRAVGLDPTKTRPSSEALLRRAIKGKGLYRVHPLVDLFNLASLRHLLPVGLYDLSRVVGERVEVRLGDQGWGFDGIRRGWINVSGRLCVVDADGPFGSPTADSARTSIEGEVPQALAIFFQHLSGDPARLGAALDTAETLVRELLGGAIAQREISA